jgi:hypothetical protein
LLREFFDAAGPWLRGQVPPDALRALGPTPATDADLAFYPLLTQWGYRSTLRELFAAVAAVLEAHGGPPWDAVADAFFAAHPPGGFVLQDLARPFAGWLEGHLAGATFFDDRALGVDTATALGALADHTHTRILARYAVDGDGLFLDERVFVRRYPVDVVALTRDPRAPAGGTTTVCLFRDLRDDALRTFVPTLATMAAFAALLGQPRTGALALPDDAVAAELERLVALGVLDPRTADAAR